MPVLHSFACQLVIASATSSLPVVACSFAPMAQEVCTGLKSSFTATRFFQLVEETGDPALTRVWSWYGLPSRSRCPCGTMTSQQERPVTVPPFLIGAPQPSCGASLTVWVSKICVPVPSGLVRAKSTSLVVL
ncbi:hypothetical protein ACFQZC_18700 [Streptacidiphilus monticola]